MLTPKKKILIMSFFTGEVTSLLRGGAEGARLIQASAHVRLTCGGATKLLPYALTWSLT